MSAVKMFHPMLLLLMSSGVGAYVYSCEAVKYHILNTNFEKEGPLSACVIVQEGYTNWVQLEKIHARAGNISSSFADLAKGSRCIENPNSMNKVPWTIVAEAGLDLNCTQKFTLLLYTGTTDIITPISEVQEESVRTPGRYHYPSLMRIFVAPQTGMWIRIKSCTGKGSISLWSGAGSGLGGTTPEDSFFLKSWECSSMPNWIVTFDSAFLINMISASQLILTLEYWTLKPINSPRFTLESTEMSAKRTVSPGDKIFVFSSGKSDNSQLLEGGNNHYAGFRLPNEDPQEFSVAFDLNFVKSKIGFVEMSWNERMKSFNYLNASGFYKEEANSFEVYYKPERIPASNIGNSEDHILIDISIASRDTTTPSATSMSSSQVPASHSDPVITTPAPTDKPVGHNVTIPPPIPVNTTAATVATPLPKSDEKTTQATNGESGGHNVTLSSPIPVNTTSAPLTTPPPKSDEKNPYCNCAVDKFGYPSGWSFDEIWLDIVVILDTSESMGKAGLDDAAGLIESFIFDGIDEVLVTNETAQFYTRVGVISMSDKAEILYNLNMTASDVVKTKAFIKEGVHQINITDAFHAALDMFNEGSKTKPERENTRQVIYYMTDSDPKTNLNPLNQFKASQGVIIVNHFLKEAQIELPSLKELASTGYYFSSKHDHSYLTALQSFCKANCFCTRNRNAYAGSDPAVKAGGGCYHPGPAGVPFHKAKSVCSGAGGILATIHDEQKARFVQNQLTSVSNSDNFWIGYERANEGGWQWTDKSNSTYTNWGENEPSKEPIAKCAHMQTTTSQLTWSAGNCRNGFPYVCEYRPCSAGYTDC